MNHQDVPDRPVEPPQLPSTPQDSVVTGPVPQQAATPQGSAEASPAHSANRGKAWKVSFVVVLVAVVAGLLWLALWLQANGQTAAPSDANGALETAVTPAATPLAAPREAVPPAEYALGDCFKDFEPEALDTTVVPCATGHSAQLVSLFRYPKDATYPGADAMKAKALEACQAAVLGPAANDYTLEFQRSYPSSTSWDSGDRRVDCYVTAAAGNVINASVLP